MRRLLLAPSLALLAGCATAVPMQTASTVDADTWRLGGSVSAAAWCGAFSGLLGMTRCTEYPNGVPLPEARGTARRGLSPGLDVGASVQVATQLIAPERPLQLGGSVEVKRELLRLPAKDGAHVLSLGTVLGGAVSGRLRLTPWWTGEVSVPLLYGRQVGQLEWVAGLALVGRVLAPPDEPATPLPVSLEQRVNLVVGLYRRGPAGWAVQVGYLTDPERFFHGALQLQFGWFFDVR